MDKLPQKNLLQANYEHMENFHGLGDEPNS